MLRSLDAAGVSTVLTSSGKLLSAKYLGKLGKCGRKLAPANSHLLCRRVMTMPRLFMNVAPHRHTLVEWSKIHFFIFNTVWRGDKRN